MKRILLFSIILSLGMVSFAQKGSLITKEQKQVMLTAVHNPVNISDLGNLEQTGNATVTNIADEEGWEVIGTTYYDFQSNSSVDNRMVTFDDGTMAAVWTFGPEGESPGFTGRGTGYVYNDGSGWGPAPTERIENDRCGWPSVAAFGENGEIVASHGSEGTQLGIYISQRATKGTGDWTSSVFEDPNGQALFPRMVTSGENNEIMHLLYSYNLASPEFNPAFYNKSSDGGLTWDVAHEILDGMSADDYNSIGGDNCVWAQPVGETVAFVFSDTWDTDLVVMKSDNNGDDWDKIIVWEHPYPFFDFATTLTTDSLWAPDGTASIAIDGEGKVHLVTALCRVIHNELGDTYNFFPYGEGIAYWNEDRPVFENDNPHHALNAWDPEILVPDVDLIGWGQDMDDDGLFTIFNAPEGLFTYRCIGAQTMPAIACGDNGQIAIAFAGISEIDVYSELYNYRRIWTRKSYDNGATWTDHYNINSDITMSFDECIYPVMNKRTDDEFHLLYQADYDVGTGLDGDHDYLENRMTYYHDFIVGMNDRPAAEQFISVSQNYPNPATTTTRINVELPVIGSELSLEVTNIVGQVVYSENKGSVNNSQNYFVINVDGYTPGVYFYTVKVNEESVTHKMIVE